MKMNNKSIYVFGILGCLAAFQLQAVQETAPSSGDNGSPVGKSISLMTGNGFELGISASHYRYKEDVVGDPFMQASGRRFDLLLDGHMTFKSDYFFEAKLNVGSSRIDYNR